MADETDDDLVMVEAESLPDPNAPPPPPPEDHDDDDEDERLASSQDDDDGDDDAQTERTRRSRNRARKEAHRRARDNDHRTIQQLQERLAQYEQRLGVTESLALGSNEAAIDGQIAQRTHLVQQAEHWMASAIEESNGEDAAKALRVRDQAVAELKQLAAEKQQIAGVRQQATQPQSPAVDPAIARNFGLWASANTDWYNPDPRASDHLTVTARRISDELLSEGYSMSDIGHFRELSNRMRPILNPPDAPARGRRNAPPLGNSREHAPDSTRKGVVVVTPERKAAMIEAGVWDDPDLRKRYLKSYAQYDSMSSAR